MPGLAVATFIRPLSDLTAVHPFSRLVYQTTQPFPNPFLRSGGLSEAHYKRSLCKRSGICSWTVARLDHSSPGAGHRAPPCPGGLSSFVRRVPGAPLATAGLPPASAANLTH
ncbi:hypothetical protein CEXT_680081 [Caerostris extrusa]|uniref:Uncharacterized protein n=1 Tax=Caerostris extrusa TaxID=172846 RepID=A0AAV4VAH7_CAEEX|nr:hypothetical protein CEXT_680081 [Caerostris extrusa]